jgi:rubrerythrin
MLDLNEVEILQVALAHEKQARTFYERLARHQGDTPGGDLFAFLAEEEQGHIRKLSARHGIPEFEADWEEKYLPYLIDLDRLAWEEGVDAGGAEGPDALRKGLSVAKKARTETRRTCFPSWRPRKGFISPRSRHTWKACRSPAGQSFVPEAEMKTSNPLDVMRMALERERMAVRDYTEFAKTAEEPSIREMFAFLAEEEKKHAKLLEDEIDREQNQEM